MRYLMLAVLGMLVLLMSVNEVSAKPLGPPPPPPFWILGGNTGNGPADFLGTTDGADLEIQPGAGNVGIGGAPDGNAKLDVIGTGSFAIEGTAFTGASHGGVRGFAPPGTGFGVVGQAQTNGTGGDFRSNSHWGLNAQSVSGVAGRFQTTTTSPDPGDANTAILAISSTGDLIVARDDDPVVVERFKVDNLGNVTADGSFIAGSTTTYGDGSISQATTETLTIGTDDADLTLQTTTGGDIVLSPADNVGIGGTPDGDAKLEVIGTGSFAIEGNGSGAGGSVGVRGFNTGSGTGVVGQVQGGNGRGGSFNAFGGSGVEGTSQSGDGGRFKSTSGRALVALSDSGALIVASDLDDLDPGVGGGSVKERFKVDNLGNVDVNGVLHTASDARLKTNVEPPVDVLEKLAQVRGVTYERIDREGSDRNIGVIAQELEAVFPELVSTSGDDGYKAVAYGNLTAVLIEAVKELNAENQELRARLEALEQAAGIDGSSVEPMSSGLSNLWLVLAGLALGGLVVGGTLTTVRRTRK